MNTSDYKNKEAAHYDVKAISKSASKRNYADFVTRQSRNLYFKSIEQLLANNKELKVLDYGCGSGDKHFQFSSAKIHITGIDISEKSIELANLQANEKKIMAEYLVMDCEKMTFPDNTFDVVCDFGTFSSLNFKSAVGEICRVLKKDGTLICIETYGHNPIMKIKRLLNVIRGKRTRWAAQHIMKKQHWKLLSNKFERCNIYYFHFFVLLLPPLLRILPESFGNKILMFFEKIDAVILKIKFFQPLAFKTVVILNTQKNDI